MSNEIQVASQQRGLQLHTMDDIYRFSQAVVKSGLAAKGDTAETVMVKIAMGLEVGLAAMQSVQNIAVINGKPSVWGDAMPGLCYASGLVEELAEWEEGEGDNLTAYCRAQRRGQPPVTRSFSWSDAKRAKLSSKSGPWQDYPRRMLQMRARSFALRDAFPDVLRGLIAAEEARDYPTQPYDADVKAQPAEAAVPPPPAASRAEPATQPEPESEADPKRVTDMLAAYQALGYDEATVLEIAGVQGREGITVGKLGELREAYRKLKTDGVATATTAADAATDAVTDATTQEEATT